MRITSLGCAIFGLTGQIISSIIDLAFFSLWTFWIVNGDVANIQRSFIHFGINIFALFIATYSVLISSHLCYKIYLDFDSVRSYFWTRLHCIILGLSFLLLTILELSMYLEISNAPIEHIRKEILNGNNNSSAVHELTNMQSIFQEWFYLWQRKHKCCGVDNYKDYSEYGDKRSVPSDCCRFPYQGSKNHSCGEGVLRMTYPFMQEIIYTNGCGNVIKEPLINISFYGCILAIVTATFVTITALSYLNFLQEYSQDQHRSRMKQYESEEKEQLKIIGKKQQQSFRKHPITKGGTVKAHGPKPYSSNSSSHHHSRSRSNSRTRNRTLISETMEKAQYRKEEQKYMKNVDDNEPLYNDGGSRGQKAIRDNQEKRNSTTPSRNRSGNRSTRSYSPGCTNEMNRKFEDRDNDSTAFDASPGNPFELPPFQPNDNLFLNLINVASAKKAPRNVSTSSSMEFHEDILVPRVLLSQRKKSKQVMFDPEGNVYYTDEKENEKDSNDLPPVDNFLGDRETKLLFSGNWESNCGVEKPMENLNVQADDEDLDCDPGDIIVRQLSKTDMK